ncbi:MAG: hypothetical protein NVS9B3_04020 [Gemmatimonadaceae bacterium]
MFVGPRSTRAPPGPLPEQPMPTSRSFLVASALAATTLVALARTAPAQQPPSPTTIPLWSAGAPGALGRTAADQPSLTLYYPSPLLANGAAVVVFPGGGYGHLALDHEGVQVARWLNGMGVAAAVVTYRLGPRYHHPAMLNDAQRAIRLVRARGAAWGIDPTRIGVLGFSAGGHLAATTATHFDAGRPGGADAIEGASSRPDFAVLVYPVITMADPHAHAGSRTNLLGPAPTPALATLLSNEKQVTRETPPTFLVHTSDDAAVPVENSLLFYQALRSAGVPAELHVYQTGRHGFGLAANDPVLSTWTARCEAWLSSRGLLGDRRRAMTVATTGPRPEPLHSSVFLYDSSATRPTAVGAVRKVVDSLTAVLSRLEIHVTTLAPGRTVHPPHRHAHEELMIVRDGTLEVLQNDVTRMAGPGSVIFQASNELHGLRNPGTVPATYYVIRIDPHDLPPDAKSTAAP